jgi:hypothetical protein
MARTSQVRGFATRAPATRPIVLSARPSNGGGSRALARGKSNGVKIMGANRVTRAGKAGGR